MFGTRTEIEFEATGHKGLWREEAVCGVLLFGAASSAFRFSVALEAGAAEGLPEDAIRERLRSELARDLEQALPAALGVTFRTLGPRARREEPLASMSELLSHFSSRSPLASMLAGTTPFEWREDALRRAGYQSLTPHGLVRLGDPPREAMHERWRRVLR